MHSAALSDVLKVITYVIACFLLAALITPPLFEMGKGFAHVTLTRDDPGKLTWLANKADKAGFDTYFKRALLISAVVGLYPLFRSLRLARMHCDPALPSLRDVDSSAPCRPFQSKRKGTLQAFLGFLLAAGFFVLLSWILLKLGWFEWRQHPPFEKLAGLLGYALFSALVVAILEEALFRGALLGIFLRAFRPSVAIISLSLLFAATHFLSPAPDVVILNPRSAGAGFEMLRQIGLKFLQPELMIHSFISLFLVGIILGVARYKTASLWLPVGLHAGWVFSVKVFSRLAVRKSDFPETYDLYMGKKMTEGLLPTAIIILTGIVLVISLKVLEMRKESDS